jgi:hypothetical protein
MVLQDLFRSLPRSPTYSRALTEPLVLLLKHSSPMLRFTINIALLVLRHWPRNVAMVSGMEQEAMCDFRAEALYNIDDWGEDQMLKK